MGVNGILNVNKPSGPTSFSIVSQIRRITGEKRVGHAGTLDPAATGVLPVCLGQATRVVEFLLGCPKEYIAGIELGTSTDTFDGEGRVTGRQDTGHITLPLIQETLILFEGSIDQVPPAYSAIKVKGRQSYELARAGIEVSHQPRKVRIDSIELLAFNHPYLKVKVLCSKGTYIRSLAHDLGKKLGCGAFLKDLVRTAYGPFKIAGAVSPASFQDALRDSTAGSLIYPTDYPLLGWDKQVLDQGEAQGVRQGHDLDLGQVNFENNIYCRAYSPDGRFLAIMKAVPESGLWHPEKVFDL